MSDNSPRCYIGLPQWNHPDWGDGPLAGNSQSHPLGLYARYFSSVEGNTTFYGLPSPDAINRWLSETTDPFRFCFKFPQTISHLSQLRHCDKELTELFNCMQKLEDRLGLLCLQLPETFGPRDLPQLQDFFNILPSGFNYSIEVRNIGFFKKDDQERDFNRLLLDCGINRTTFDTRPLFNHPATDHATQEALSAKPNMPVHVLATGMQPMVRFITAMDWRSSTNYLTPWINKVVQWLDEGRSPYIFLHTPDNRSAPDVARVFAAKLEAERPGQVCFTDWPDSQQQQSALF